MFTMAMEWRFRLYIEAWNWQYQLIAVLLMICYMPRNTYQLIAVLLMICYMTRNTYQLIAVLLMVCYMPRNTYQLIAVLLMICYMPRNTYQLIAVLLMICYITRNTNQLIAVLLMLCYMTINTYQHIAVLLMICYMTRSTYQLIAVLLMVCYITRNTNQLIAVYWCYVIWLETLINSLLNLLMICYSMLQHRVSWGDLFICFAINEVSEFLFVDDNKACSKLVLINVRWVTSTVHFLQAKIPICVRQNALRWVIVTLQLL